MYDCDLVSDSYYCAGENDSTQKDFPGMKPWNLWQNCMMLVLTILVFSQFAFLVSYLLHKCKLCGTKPYTFDSKQKKQSNSKPKLKKVSSVIEDKEDIMRILFPKLTVGDDDY